MPLLFECRVDGSAEWERYYYRPADIPGSAIDTSQGRSDVILFACMGPLSSVTRALGAGSSALDVAPQIRAVLVPRGQLESLARLADGESFELTIRNAHGKSYLARWTHLGARRTHDDY